MNSATPLPLIIALLAAVACSSESNDSVKRRNDANSPRHRHERLPLVPCRRVAQVDPNAGAALPRRIREDEGADGEGGRRAAKRKPTASPRNCLEDRARSRARGGINFRGKHFPIGRGGWSAPRQTGHSAGVDDWLAMNSRGERIRKPLCGWTGRTGRAQARTAAPAGRGRRTRAPTRCAAAPASRLRSRPPVRRHRLLGRAVARVEVRVQLPRQTPVGAADLLRGSVRLHAKDGVGVVVHGRLTGQGRRGRRKGRRRRTSARPKPGPAEWPLGPTP